MSPLGLPLATCAAVITGCLGISTTDVDSATIKAINNYCAVSWHRANIPRQDWDDCSQHAFVRLLTRVSQDRLAEAIEDAHSKQRRELNRSIWATTQWWRRSHRHCPIVGDDLPDPAETLRVSGVTAIDIQEALGSEAVGLTTLQRCVLDLWSAGHNIGEIASNLGVPSRRVSDEKYKAISRLRASFLTC